MKISDLTKKKTGRFVWTKEANEAFEILKKKLITAPILAFPDMKSEEPLILTVDTSSTGIGYVLSQRQISDHTGKLIERPISYGSTHLRGSQTKMGSTDLELTGVCFAIKKLDCWLRGVKFLLITDHKSLTFLINKRMDEMKPAIARKVIFLQQYDFDIIHKDGEKIKHADALSMYIPNTNIEEDIEPILNTIQGKHESNSGILDIKEIGVGEMTLQNVRRLQKLDTFYNGMYRYLHYEHLPKDKLLARKIKSNKNRYIVDNELIYHLWNKRLNRHIYKQLCIPRELRPKILSLLHDTNFTGHKGTHKMYEDAIRHFWWNNMYKDIQNYVSTCKLCLKTNTGHSPKIPLNPLEIPSAPFQTIHVDLLKFHTPSKGNNFILVIIDAFSKFVITKAIKKKTACTVIKAIYEEFILKFGMCKHLSIISDNGLEFINSWSKTLYKLLGVKSIKTSVYKPTTNSQCERTNRSIISILRKFVCDNPKNLSKNLCYVTYVINTSVSESTKASPFSLIYGTEATSVLDLCLPEEPENVHKTMKQSQNYWIDNLTLLRKLARENMICSKQKQKIQYDRHTRPHNFIVGDKVFIKIHRLLDNEDGKLRPQYKGIYTIKSFLSPSNVILTDDNGRQLSRSVYINNLKKCSDRKQFNVADDQLVRQNGRDNSKSEEDNSSLSDQSEYEEEISQHSENNVNHEVVNSNQHQDNDDMNHDVEDSTHQQPLSADGGIDQDGQEDECVDSDLPFSGLDDDSLVEEMKDISQQQGKPTIQSLKSL